MTTTRTRIQHFFARPGRHPSLGDYLDRWLELCQSRGLQPATLASYQATLRLYVDADLRATSLDRVTPEAVNRMYADLLRSGRRHGSSGLSARSVRYVHVLLKKAYADAIRLGYADRNPVELADPPSLKAARARVRAPWSSEELAEFLAAAREDPFYPAYHLAASTGMRRGEVLGLRWSDLDLQGRELHVIQTIVEAGHTPTVGVPKSERSRRLIALDSRTVEVLRDHHEVELRRRHDHLASVGALVFAQVDGSAIHPACFSYAFAHRVRVVGVRRVRFHDLRHGHATMALRAGIHPKVVSERLGHSSIATTLDIYSHAIPSMQREAADAVAALYEPRITPGTWERSEEPAAR